ncbi:acyl-CoA dehydrogenase family protein [Brachyspira aalborgi]|uniref:Acyl-CoA dehydrogenase n=1 Tax=Brachyspira aalborgi TaxID=29522 RepID=A0A5C8EJY3_9SPIR|nr:acyl-CoA dehydrogenase family protein [Brachyspira aalborgi]TXJ38095.1 acyl-CoA dehydrogenase [Brachyspira aalborgi]
MTKTFEDAMKFAEQHVKPYTEEVDRDGRFPKEAYNELRKQGYMGVIVPKEYGGMGGGAKEHAEVVHALSNYCTTTGLCYMMHNAGTKCLIDYGTEEQKKEFLPKIAKGEVAIALAYSESGSGTHFGSPDMTETKSGSRIILNGRKSFVTSALFADYYLTLSNSCENKGTLNNWLVHNNSKGITHEENKWDGLGMRGNASMPVAYDNVELDISYRVGKEGDGENQSGSVLPYFVVGLGAVYSGLARNAYNCILDYTKNRKYTSGQSLADIEMVQVNLAEIYTKMQSAVAFTFAAAESLDNNEADSGLKIFGCRINSIEVAVEVCQKAMKLGGGNAYAKRLPLERYMRDALAAPVMAPGIDVLKTWLGKAIVS